MAIRFLNSQSIDGDLTVTGNVGIGDDNPDGLLSIKGDGAQIIIDDTDTTDNPRLRLRESGFTSGSIYTDGKELIFDSGTSEKMRIDTAGNVGINNTSPDYELDVTGDIQYSGTLFNGPRQEYSGSNFISANQAYTGNLVGSYFVGGDYQKVVTIIPSGASQNYQIVGNIYVQSGASTQVIEVNASLRSNTLPDLSWEIYYEESNTGTRFVKPFLWTKETTTAGFIFGIEVLSGITIYGNVTADLMINSRSSAHKANVSINTVTASDQLTIDTGYTQREFTQRSTWDENYLGIGTTNPGSLLHIEGDTTGLVTGLVVNNAASAGNFTSVSGIEIRNGAGTDSSTHIEQDSFGFTRFYTGQAAKNQFLTAAANGNVGIGTTNPMEKLEVVGKTLVSYDGADDFIKQSVNGTVSTLAFGNTEGSGGIAKWEYNRSNGNFSGFTGIAAATEFMTVKANGNVGIGTTNPSTLLHVSSTTNPSIRVTGVTSNSSDPAIELLGTANSFAEGGQLWYDNGSGVLHLSSLFNSTAADIQFHTRVAADRGTGNVRMTISGDGFVGVGTTNPGYLLDVQGTTDPAIRVRSTGTGSSDDALVRIRIGGSTASSILAFGDAATYAAGQIRYTHSVDAMRLYTAGTEKVRIASTGNVGIGTTSPDYALDVSGDIRASDDLFVNAIEATANITGAKLGINYSSPTQAVEVNGIITAASGFGFKLGNTNQTAIGKWYSASGVNYLEGDSTRSFQIGSATNGVNVRFDNFNNRVGIGTTSPSQHLHVNGNVVIEGALYDSGNSQGTSGQVLSSTGSGTSWVNEGSSVGVSSIIAGTNITISPTGGTGAVTINASSGGGGGGSRTASFNSAFYQSGTGNYYLPISIESEQTSRQRGNTIVPPFNAYLKSVTMTHSSISAPTSGTRTLTMQDSSGTTIEAITVNYNDYASVGVGRYTWTFTFTSSAQITAGRPFWIYGTNNFNVGWGNAIYTILLEEQ